MRSGLPNGSECARGPFPSCYYRRGYSQPQPAFGCERIQSPPRSRRLSRASRRRSRSQSHSSLSANVRPRGPQLALGLRPRCYIGPTPANCTRTPAPWRFTDAVHDPSAASPERPQRSASDVSASSTAVTGPLAPALSTARILAKPRPAFHQLRHRPCLIRTNMLTCAASGGSSVAAIRA